MLLQGNLREFSLPNVFQLVKMSAKSGALTIRREEEWARIFFRNGQISYAFVVPQALPLGERLVKAGKLTPVHLKAALSQQEADDGNGRLGAILLAKGFIDRESLETAVRAQIEDAAFNCFGWAEGEFEFSVEETADDEDILVAMNVENVIMEGCRRIDEWELIFASLGSLECVPHLNYDGRVQERGEVQLTPDEWSVVCHVDGRCDIGTVLHECRLDRFQAAKVIYSLYASGLLTVSEPGIENIGKGRFIAIRGPIEIYNEIFLNTLADRNVTKHLCVETIDEKEVEIPLSVASVPLFSDGAAAGDKGEGAESDGHSSRETLVFTAGAEVSDEVWKRLVGESSVFVVLANAESQDSLSIAKRDIALVHDLGDVALVVATYVSTAGEALSAKIVRKVLGLAAAVPVVQFSLRDHESVLNVVKVAAALTEA